MSYAVFLYDWGTNLYPASTQKCTHHTDLPSSCLIPSEAPMFLLQGFAFLFFYLASHPTSITTVPIAIVAAYKDEFFHKYFIQELKPLIKILLY